jgi:hypothetical protein
LQGKHPLTGKEVLGSKEQPDIAVAQARLKTAKAQTLEAEAVLSRTRLKALNQINVLYHNLAAQKAGLAEVQEQHAKNGALFRKGCISRQELQLSAMTVETYRAKLAELQAQLPYLIGEQPEGVAQPD